MLFPNPNISEMLKKGKKERKKNPPTGPTTIHLPSDPSCFPYLFIYLYF